MIYQFKVGLKGMSPPIWRRLQVDGNMSFYEFHQVLQLAFDWDDSHLHSFIVLRRNGRKTDVEIGSIDEEIEFPFFSFREVFDEHEEKITDWFMTEKDRTIYTYDFGADWEHEIVLEKIVKPELNMHYPYCVKAMRLVPEEDSWGMKGASEEMDWRELTEEINLKLKTIEMNVTHFSHPMEEVFDWRMLIEEARSFNKLKPWEFLEDDQLFIVADGESGQFLYCSVLGAGDEEFGLAVYVGNEGLQALKATLSGESAMDTFLKQRSLLLSFVDRDELESSDYEFLKQHDMSFRGRKQWIQLRSFVPGSYPWHLDEEEGRMLLLAIEQAKEMLSEVEKGLAIPHYTGGNKFFGRMVRDTEDGLDWQSVQIELLEKKQEKGATQLFISELDMKRLKKMHTVNTSIILDSFMIDKPIQDSPTERPYFPTVIVVMDEESGYVLHQQMIKLISAEEIQLTFIKMIEQLGGLPKTVTVKNDTAEYLSPITIQLPIVINKVRGIPAIDELREFMGRMPW